MTVSPQAMGSLSRQLCTIWPGALVAESGDFASLPASGGAYALLIAIDNAFTICIGRKQLEVLPGLYVYAGSAYGPGGLRARLRRHGRHDKALHWQVDRLTIAASHLAALAIEGGHECAIISRLTEAGCFHHPWPGFGSSDCRCCPSHLLRQTS